MGNVPPSEVGNLLLLLRSPAISLGLTIWGEIFAYVTVFNPTTEVATFRLHGLFNKTNIGIVPVLSNLGGWGGGGKGDCLDGVECKTKPFSSGNWKRSQSHF